MRKIIYLFITLITLQSCSDDDSTNNDIDPIIGTWKLTSDTLNGEEQITECKANSTLYFNEDGTYSTDTYNEDDDGNCILDGSVDNANWVNEGDSLYTFTTFDEDNEDEYTEMLSFSDNNNTFTFTETDTYNGETDTYVSVFTKQ